MAHIGLLFGGRTVEHEVSVSSARTVARGLRQAGHRLTPLAIAPDGCWVDPALGERALAGELDRLPPRGEPVASTLAVLLEADVEALFPLVHGTWGEDGTLQGLCEMLDLPYAGAGVTTSALCMDKVLCKELLAARGLPVVDWETVTRVDFDRDSKTVARRLERFEPPVFVKPAVGGSSVGVTKVAELDHLPGALEHAFAFDDRVLVERGVEGRELECAVLGDRSLAASVIGEIVPGKEFYDYADKYLEDNAQLIAPAELDEAVSDRLRDVATTAFGAVGGWGMARVDFLLEDAERFWINEINTLPGFTDISMFPRLWQLTGLSLAQLTDRLVRIAFDRHAERRRLDRGIKAWIEAITPK